MSVHDAMRHRFHRAPLIQGADLLLQERVPHGADQGIPLFILADAEVKEVQPPVRRLPSPMSVTPSTHLLSNGRYASDDHRRRFRL